MGEQHPPYRHLRRELRRLRVELAGWREVLLAVISDGTTQGAIDWQHVREARARLAETRQNLDCVRLELSAAGRPNGVGWSG